MKTFQKKGHTIAMIKSVLNSFGVQFGADKGDGPQMLTLVPYKK